MFLKWVTSNILQTESFVGYAQWVMTTLLDVEKRNTANFRYAIDRLEAIPVACDGIGHVIGRLQFCYQSNYPNVCLT